LALDGRGAPVRAPLPDRARRLPHRPERDGVRNAAGAFPRDGGDGVRRWRRDGRAGGCGAGGRGAARRAGQRLGGGGRGGGRRQGRAVIFAVIVWGLAVTGFGLVRWLPLALVLLAVAGWADVVSAVFRNTIVQFSGPDSMRGRLMGVQMAVVAGGPRLGDLESGAGATAFGTTFSVVSGGLARVAGALLVARSLPGFRYQRSAVPKGSAEEGREGADLAPA